MDFHIFSLSR